MGVNRVWRGAMWAVAAAGVALALTLPGCGKGSGSAKQAFERGKKHLSAGDRKKAVAAFTAAINADSGYAPAYTWRGVAHNEMGEHKKALADFSKAIKLDPADGYAYEQRALIYRNVLKDAAKAKADDEKAAAVREKGWENLKKLRKQKKK